MRIHITFPSYLLTFVGDCKQAWIRNSVCPRYNKLIHSLGDCASDLARDKTLFTYITWRWDRSAEEIFQDFRPSFWTFAHWLSLMMIQSFHESDESGLWCQRSEKWAEDLNSKRLWIHFHKTYPRGLFLKVYFHIYRLHEIYIIYIR